MEETEWIELSLEVMKNIADVNGREKEIFRDRNSENWKCRSF